LENPTPETENTLFKEEHMRKGLSLLMTLCVLMTMTTALTACSGGKSGSSSIVVGIAQDLEDSLDPHKAVAAGTKEILFNVFEGLLKPDSEGNIVPAVAESYTVSDDGLVYTFTIRDGIKFHNGNPVTAEDVKYSIEKSAGMTGEESLIAAFSAIKEVKIVDEKTVSIALSEVNVDFPTYIANANASIIPADNADNDNSPIGTGPYMYVSRSPQENIIVKKFDEYWGTPANIENVTFKIIADTDSVVVSLMGGTVDMFAHLTVDQVNQLTKGYNKLEGTMNLVQALYLNNAVAPFDNEDVRKALCYAIDEEGILELTSEGKGTPIGSSMFPAFKKYYKDLSDAYPHDVEKAKELLAGAGYPDGFEFTITVPSNYEPHINTAQVIAEQLKEVGVTANIQLVEWNTWLSEVYAGRNYESTVIGVDASSMTARALLERFNSAADNNFVNFSDSEYDDLYQKVVATTDEAEQVELYTRMEEILSERAANVYIQDMAEFVALSDKFDGYKFYPLYVQDIASIYEK